MLQRKERRNGAPVATPRRASTHLLPTLIDRLRNDAPQRQIEAPGEYAVSRAQMRDILQRDLTLLLNTTNIEDRIDRARYPQAAASTINFGMPPFSGAFMDSRRWGEIEQMIRRAIREFEPRLMPQTLSVRSLTQPDVDEHYNVLLFEVSGMVHMDPYPLEFLVQSAIDLETGRVNTAGVRAT